MKVGPAVESVSREAITKVATSSPTWVFCPPRPGTCEWRSQMMTALWKFIVNEQLTQAEVAARLKVTQPRIPI